MNLDSMSLDELERVYREAPFGPLPTGLFRGRVVAWLDTPGSRRPIYRAPERVMFGLTPFGVDFDHNGWWFLSPRLLAGRFVAAAGPSRWRTTETLRLDYSVSRLPGRGLLYDEVKPLAADLCLGIGGINANRGEGDHFFFSLTRG